MKKYKYYRFTFHVLILIFFLFMPLYPLIFSPETTELPSLKTFDETILLTNFPKWLIIHIALTSVYIINVMYIIPKYLLKQNYIKYILSLFACFIILFSIKYIPSSNPKINSQNLSFEPKIIPLGEGKINESLIKESVLVKQPLPIVLFPLILLLGIGTSFEMILNWEIERRKRDKTNQEKTKAELAYLKSQINPHFLFNTLSNIYSLVSLKSANSGNAILLLSGLMRYMFLESKEGKITLTKEIEHITNYIELQKLRLSENNKVFFSYPDTTLTNSLSIEPLILLTFVENAFKYGISSEYEFTIKVFIDVYETNLKLYVENNINHLKRAEEESNGIGLKNTKRRLDLIYAGKHKLDIVENDTAYIVNLQIELK